MSRECNFVSDERGALARNMQNLTFASLSRSSAHSFLIHARASCSSSRPWTPDGLCAIPLAHFRKCVCSLGDKADS